MAFAIDPNARVRYVLIDERDLPVAEQSVFLIGPLSISQRGEIEDAIAYQAAGGEETHYRTGTVERLSLGYRLFGWENFGPESGEEIPFERERGVTSNRTLSWIQARHATEVANAIANLSNLSRSDRD